MPLALGVDGIVERLEASCMPRLADFGRSLALSNPNIVAETFSHRHAAVTHSPGLVCHPVGTDSLDPRAVALIVTVIAIDKPSMKGYVGWQSPSLYHEGETAIYDAFGESELARFAAELDGLLGVLAAALRCGGPPGSGQRCGYDLRGNVSGVCPECGVMRP